MFKSYDQNQFVRVPLEIERLIPLGHMVRIINEVVERLEIEALKCYYTGGGCSAYHPKMMLKVWIYGFCIGIYTSRPLSRAISEQIPFLWLSGGQTPNFKTLSEFRGNRMRSIVDDVFKEVLVFLTEEGYVSLDDLYVDGSIWEANANRHKIMWRKNVERYKSAVLERVAAMLEQSRLLQAEEDRRYGSRNLAMMGESKDLSIVLSSEQISDHIISLNKLIAEKTVAPSLKKELKKTKTALRTEQEKLEKYEQQERVLGARRSFSKTDLDATGMRMKDERLLPAYNIQHTTNNQFITNFTVEQSPSDSVTLMAHLDKMAERFEGLSAPKSINLCADAGYGSEENYADLEQRNIKPYVKYPLYHMEQSGKLAKLKFKRENFPYDQQADEFTCPNNRKLKYIGSKKSVSLNGYAKELREYECENCDKCPFYAECTKSKDAKRKVQYSPQGEIYKKKAKALLKSEKGRAMRSSRCIEVESVFGDIKYNMKHRRFILRERPKVYIEYGLLAIAHNLRKVFCEKSGTWAEYYAQRKRKRA